MPDNVYEKYDPELPDDHPLHQLGTVMSADEFARLHPETENVTHVFHEKYGTFELMLSDAKSEPLIRCFETGKVFHVTWQLLVSLALARGINRNP